MKNTIILGMLMILGVACKGPEGKPGMEMTSCDVAKNEVREILTGESKNCSGLVKAAITTEEAEEKLESASRWISESGNTVVAIRNGAFYTISLLDDSIVAFRGKLEVGQDTDNNEIELVTTVFEGLELNGTMIVNEDGSITIETVRGSTRYVAGPALNLTMTDADITIVRTQADLDALNNL